MTIQVVDAEDADMYRLFEICSDAFGIDAPFWTATWPKHETESGRVAGAQRFEKIKNSDPNTTFIKAVDTSNNKIVGMAKWNIYVNHIPDLSKPDGGEDASYWNDPEEKEYADYLAYEFFAERAHAILMSKGNVVCLDIFAVDPEYQRRGVGLKMVEWGTSKADELGVQAVVEASPAGKGLYEKFGYRYKKQVGIIVPQKWEHWGGQNFAWLVRPKSHKEAERTLT